MREPSRSLTNSRAGSVARIWGLVGDLNPGCSMDHPALYHFATHSTRDQGTGTATVWLLTMAYNIRNYFEGLRNLVMRRVTS